MKTSSIWVGISATMLTALANGYVDDQKSNLSAPEVNYKKTSSAAKVWVNFDGSAHVIDTEGNVTYISAQVLDFVKKVNPGITATFEGSKPCVGKSK